MAADEHLLSYANVQPALHEERKASVTFTNIVGWPEEILGNIENS
jgi:hypothetical protein